MGIYYSLWHDNDRWDRSPHRVWGTPAIGFYKSDDEHILVTHAEQLGNAGVEFVVLDWSNNLDTDVRLETGRKSQLFIERATLKLCEVWSTLPSCPKIVIMIGVPGNPSAVIDGRLSSKADEIFDLFVRNEHNSKMVLDYLGKPLMLIYVGTPSPWRSGSPPWDDTRFTIRFVTGFITEQQSLQGPNGISRFGFWSWEDRNIPTYSIFRGYPECMTVVASWRGIGSPGRDNGRTYEDQWSEARRIGPLFVIAGTFNEWWSSEQVDENHSKDIEPSQELGEKYIDILKKETELFKNGE